MYGGDLMPGEAVISRHRTVAIHRICFAFIGGRAVQMHSTFMDRDTLAVVVFLIAVIAVLGGALAYMGILGHL